MCNSKFDIAYSTYKSGNIDKNLFNESLYYCKNSKIDISSVCYRPDILGIENEYLLSNLCSVYEDIVAIKSNYSEDVVFYDTREKEYYNYNKKYTEINIEKILRKKNEYIELYYKKILDRI